MTKAQEERIQGLKTDLDSVTRERDALALVVDSLREIVRIGWVHRQEPCPFCRGVFNHKAFCYLNCHAGRAVMAEYAEIERQRDYLLTRVRALTGQSEVPKGRSLKARFRKT